MLNGLCLMKIPTCVMEIPTGLIKITIITNDFVDHIILYSITLKFIIQKRFTI